LGGNRKVTGGEEGGEPLGSNILSLQRTEYQTLGGEREIGRPWNSLAAIKHERKKKGMGGDVEERKTRNFNRKLADNLVSERGE